VNPVPFKARMEKPPERGGGDTVYPRTVQVELFSEYGDAKWPLAEFAAMVSAALEQVPPEYRNCARVELDGGDLVRGGIGYLRAWYTKPEADEDG
jgi:hypothetical protein